jgi:hypothetical protein
MNYWFLGYVMLSVAGFLIAGYSIYKQNEGWISVKEILQVLLTSAAPILQLWLLCAAIADLTRIDPRLNTLLNDRGIGKKPPRKREP